MANVSTRQCGMATAAGGYFSTFGVAPVGSIGTCYGIDLKGNKIVYFSPDFGGLTFGVSYQPQAYSRSPGAVLPMGPMSRRRSPAAAPISCRSRPTMSTTSAG